MEDTAFRTSSFCTDAHGCVEVRIDDDLVRVRDAKDRQGGQLAFTPEEWTIFVRGVKAGEFDL